MTIRADDALKYAAAILKSTADWTDDAIGGSGCDAGHDIERDALNDVVREIAELASTYGDLHHYSDGRQVQSRATIEYGVYTCHIWKPDPHAEEPLTWTGELGHDPGTKPRGQYTVTTDPLTQQINVCVIKALALAGAIDPEVVR
ncbi:hypothetical protein H7J06_24585 [Mycobacterium hodleri]|uniref:hypothetical protein n=1 Tax=Mycolicibacterium hodleri TaxID=49897 RepID=UPI0021F38FEC|nr:hypothetical protein [Mycolicibacterium hodleri]MCV7136154.1 hypothetical protein [Mycolicibacterium hodleri]